MSGNVTSSYTDSPSSFFLNSLGQLSWCSLHCIQTFAGYSSAVPGVYGHSHPTVFSASLGVFSGLLIANSATHLPQSDIFHTPPPIFFLLFLFVFCSSVTWSHIPGCSHLHPTIWQALTSTSHRARGAFHQSSRDCACVAVDEPMTLFSRLWKASRSSGCLVGMGRSDTALGQHL